MSWLVWRDDMFPKHICQGAGTGARDHCASKRLQIIDLCRLDVTVAEGLSRVITMTDSRPFLTITPQQQTEQQYSVLALRDDPSFPADIRH